MKRIGVWSGLALAALAVVVWASDKVSYEGERTVYTVQCRDGTWQQGRCTGRLEADLRYRFRASKSRQQVVYWIVGSSSPYAIYSDCKVSDRGNWTCRASAADAPTITHAMAGGQPVRDQSGTTVSFHAVRKWQWWLLRVGVPVTSTAE